ncbi:uncharacterized protein LOC141577058 isoform X1 [Camelus bactrianus]|uniref:Uncharacterized protein LOC141577058 isoform X1 n=1 Tax=Camelus bactrianus TaxID=9837 RepID=A0AC58Q2A9_CAMBA
MWAGCAFRRLPSEPRQAAGGLRRSSSTRRGSAQSRYGAVPALPAERILPSLGKWQARGGQPMPACWSKRTYGPQFSDKEVWGPGAKPVRPQEAPGAGWLPAPVWLEFVEPQRLRSPHQPALRAQPALPAARPPKAPAETRPSPTLRPARSCSRARAAPAAAQTRASEAPARILPDILRPPAAPTTFPARQGREGGETRLPAGSKPAPPQSSS